MNCITRQALLVFLSATSLSFWASIALGQTQLDVKALGSKSDAQTPSVNLLVNILDSDNVPLEGLKQEDFIVRTAPNDTELKDVPFQLLPPSQQRNPDPAVIIVLLDVSGSMTSPDSSGNEKFVSALDAIERFSGWLQQSNLRETTYLAIVPFNVGIGSCKDRVVTSEILANTLVPVTNAGFIGQELDNLASITPCGATNLYSSVANTVNFLRQEFLSANGINLSQYSQLKTTDKPRLVIITFSDGYDTESRNHGQESEQFQALNSLIKDSPAITVHTLGYGESLETVINRPDVKNKNGRFSTCSDVVTPADLRASNSPLDLVLENCYLDSEKSDQILAQLLVDAPRLEQMAGDRGIYRFPRTASEVQEAFEDFFNSLRQYEIEYYQEDAQEGQKYQIEVSLNPEHPLAPAQNTTEFLFSNVILRPLPPLQRYGIFVITIAILGIVIYRFVKWSSQQRQIMEKMI